MASATGDEAAHPGLVIEWRKGSESWSALVTYVVQDGGNSVVVTQWLDGALLRPAHQGLSSDDLWLQS